MTINKGLIRILQTLLIPLIFGIIGLLLLTLAFLLPAERIEEHVVASASDLYLEGTYSSVTPKLAGTQLDNYTDALYLNQALVSNKDANLIDCILEGYQFSGAAPSEGPVITLKAVTEDPENRSLTNENKRFFNGYVLPVKILLLFTHYSGIRQVNLYLALFLFLALMALLIRRSLQRFLPPVIVSLLLLHPLTMTLNISSFGFYVCMMIPSIVILSLKPETLKQRGWLIFGITGAATYYFNMNFIQLLTFGVPILFFWLITDLPRKPLKLLGKTAEYFLTWMTGLVGMMVFKWMIYAIAKNPAVFQEMLDQFLFRAGLSEGTRTDAIIRNILIVFENKWWNLLELFYVCYSVIQRIRSKERFSVSSSQIMLLVIAFLLPLARCLIFPNHVLIHAWTTYRLFVIPVMAFNFWLTGKEKCSF